MVKAPGSSWKVLVYELVGLVMRRIIFWLRAEEFFFCRLFAWFALIRPCQPGQSTCALRENALFIDESIPFPVYWKCNITNACGAS